MLMLSRENRTSFISWYGSGRDKTRFVICLANKSTIKSIIHQTRRARVLVPQHPPGNFEAGNHNNRFHVLAINFRQVVNRALFGLHRTGPACFENEPTTLAPTLLPSNVDGTN